MGKKRVFTKMLPSDSEKMPAIRVEFRGKYQVDYHSLNKIANEDFETSGTALSRLVLHEWIRDYQRKKREGKPTGTQQMVMILKGEWVAPSKKSRKKESENAG